MSIETEFNNSLSSADLWFGTPVRGQLSSRSDFDYYKIILLPGTVSFSFDSPRNSSLDYHDIRILNSAGAVLAATSTGENTTITTAIGSTGTYYVSVDAGAFFDSGQYSLQKISGVANAELESNNSIATATALRTGIAYSGQLSSRSDLDYYSINASAGTISVSFDSPRNSSLDYHDIKILNSAGAVLAATSTGENTTLSTAVSSSGTYYVSVDAGAFFDSGQYEINVTAPNAGSRFPVDIAEDRSTTASIAVGGSEISNHVAGDFEDWFAVTLIDGIQYTFASKGSATGSGTMSDPYLQLYDGAGRFINGNDDSGVGLNAELVHTATTSGTHYIASTSGSLNNFSIGTYTLSVSAPVNVAPIASNDTATATAGQAVTINIGFNDTDADGDRLTTTGLTSPLQGTVSYRNNVSTADTVTYTPSLTASGTDSFTYQVLDGKGGSDTATVTVTILAADLAGNTSTTGRVNVGSNFVSEHTTGDFQDWIAVSLVAGTSYEINLEGVSTSAGTMSDPYLAIYNRSGVFIQGDRDSGTGTNDKIVFTAPSSGVYYLASSSANQNNFSTGTYKLSIKEQLPLPIVGNDIGVVTVGNSVRIAVGENDIDQTGGGLITTILSSPALYSRLGTVSVTENTDADFIAFSAFSNASPGVVDLSYSVTDDRGESANGFARVVIAAEADIPHKAPESNTFLNAGQSLTSFLGDGSDRGIFSAELEPLIFNFNNDKDYINVALNEGSIYEIRVSNNSDNNYIGYTAFTSGEIEDENVFVPNSFNLVGDSVVSFIATTTGIHSLEISGFGGASYGGTYTASLNESIFSANSIISDGVYRFFNTSNGVHFYTSSYNERTNIVNTLPNFILEGPAFRAADPDNGATSPVARFLNTQTGTHFFTQSVAEKQNIIANLAHFNLEGDSYLAYVSQVSGSTPLYRFFNTNTGTHFFTANKPEAQSVVDNLESFNYEGIAYYVDTAVGDPFFGEPIVPERPAPIEEVPIIEPDPIIEPPIFSLPGFDDIGGL